MPFAECADCGKKKKKKKKQTGEASQMPPFSLPEMLTKAHMTMLSEVICPKCGKLTPSSGEGKPQLLALPNSYVFIASTTCGAATRREAANIGITNKEDTDLHCECNECFDDERAVSKCLDCKAVLCEVHSQSHPRSRSTHNHTVRAIEEADGLNSETEPQLAGCPASYIPMANWKSSAPFARNFSVSNVWSEEVTAKGAVTYHILY